MITNKVYSYNTNYAAIQKFIDTRGTIIGDGSTDADWAQVKQKLYDAFELARVDSLASVNAATDSGITNPDSMMAMM